MKKVFFTLIFSFFSLTLDVYAQTTNQYEKECLSFIKKPSVSLQSSYGKLRYDFDKDENFLRRETIKKFSNQPYPMEDDFTPIGLTKVRDNFDFDFTVGQIKLSHGYTCVYPENISARLEYVFPTIYILNSLKKDSCLYNLAIRHEKTHMQIYIEAMDYFLPALKTHLDGLFAKVGIKIVSPGDSIDEAIKNLNQSYVSAIEQPIALWRAELETEQKKLDTKEQYILENTLCQELEAKGNQQL